MRRPPPRLHKAEALRILRRTGYSEDQIAELDSSLPDDIDVERDRAILDRFGINQEQLMNRMGGSP